MSYQVFFFVFCSACYTHSLSFYQNITEFFFLLRYCMKKYQSKLSSLYLQIRRKFEFCNCFLVADLRLLTPNSHFNHYFISILNECIIQKFLKGIIYFKFFQYLQLCESFYSAIANSEEQSF